VLLEILGLLIHVFLGCTPAMTQDMHRAISANLKQHPGLIVASVQSAINTALRCYDHSAP
jgi:hypothetical protein